jgi:hypothetical protein
MATKRKPASGVGLMDMIISPSIASSSGKDKQASKYYPNRHMAIITLAALTFIAMWTFLSSSSASIHGAAATSHQRPFPMPIHGGSRFDIFQPLYDLPESVLGQQLLASPEDFFSFFEERLEWLDTITINKIASDSFSLQGRARFAYLEMLKSHLTGAVFNSAEHSVHPRLNTKKNELGAFNLEAREVGGDWTYLGDTMTGWARIRNVADLLKDVIENQVPGDYMETGVWRGGSSMFARAVLRTYDNQADKRKSFVCDSFRGLPPGDKNLAKGDHGWDKTSYLEVSENIVAKGFRKYGLLDSNVIFAKGFFNETMPPLSEHVKKLAIMRLDVSATGRHGCLVVNFLECCWSHHIVLWILLHTRSRFF